MPIMSKRRRNTLTARTYAGNIRVLRRSLRDPPPLVFEKKTEMS
jgi:hypothetical protein